MTQVATRRLYNVRTAGDPIAKSDPDWLARHRWRVKCRFCCGPSREWVRSPHGVDVVIKWTPRGSTVILLELPIKLVHRDLHRVLAPHARGCYFGRVRVPGANGPTDTEYVSWIGHPSGVVYVNRGLDGFYKRCGSCGQVAWKSGHRFVAVERNLDSHAVYMGNDDWFLLDADFMARRRLRERFPDLRTFRVRVVPEPLDGETLPGDPGWDGTFRPRFTSVPQRERILEAERAAAKAGGGRTSGTPQPPAPPRPKTPKPHTSRRTKRKRA